MSYQEQDQKNFLELIRRISKWPEEELAHCMAAADDLKAQAQAKFAAAATKPDSVQDVQQAYKKVSAAMQAKHAERDKIFYETLQLIGSYLDKKSYEHLAQIDFKVNALYVFEPFAKL